METLVILGLVGVVGYYIYRVGKREGSRKGYGIGRSRGRRHR